MNKPLEARSNDSAQHNANAKQRQRERTREIDVIAIDYAALYDLVIVVVVLLFHRMLRTKKKYRAHTENRKLMENNFHLYFYLFFFDHATEKKFLHFESLCKRMLILNFESILVFAFNSLTKYLMQTISIQNTCRKKITVATNFACL